MKNDVVSERYALAIYDIAKQEKNILKIYENLNEIAFHINKNSDFKTLMTHPLISDKEKKMAINKLYSKYFEPTTVNMINYLIDKKRIVYIDRIMIEYLKYYHLENNIIEVEAIFAIKPSKEQEKTLIDKLKKKYSKDVKLNIKVDESILAGGILKIGDEIIDGSLKRQFEILKSKI